MELVLLIIIGLLLAGFIVLMCSSTSSKYIKVEKDEIPHVIKQPCAGYYQHTFICSNCDIQNKRYVLTGIRHSYCETVCDNCGCKIQGALRMAGFLD